MKTQIPAPLARFAAAAASFFILSFAAPSASAEEHTHASPSAAPATVTSAIAVLIPAADSHVAGTVKFTQESEGVRVEADITGLTPGKHGFHVHEKGDLSKPDLTSAGGHFNPESQPHADRTAGERHVGDLGNLEAGADGHATASFVDSRIKLSGPNSIIGRAVIVHAKADDLKSQPTGESGGRVAGGVVGIVK